MSWSNDLKKLTTKGGKDLGKLARTIKIELFSGVVEDTRVDTGRLKGNWQIQENAKASGEVDTEDNTPKGTMSGESKANILKGSTESGKTYFTNNLPYAAVYEEKDAMVGRNVARLKQNVRRMAKAL